MTGKKQRAVDSSEKLFEKIEEVRKHHEELARNVARLEGSLDPKREKPWYKTFAGYLAPALILYLGWLGSQVVEHGKALTRLDAQNGSTLTAARLLGSASQPLREDSQQDAQAILRQASGRNGRAQKRPAVPESVIGQAGVSFVDASKASAGAWETAVQFVNYRSQISQWFNQTSESLRQNDYPWCFSALPKDNGLSISPDRKELKLFSRPLIYENCVMKLDDPHTARFLAGVPSGVIFRHCLVKYSGGKIVGPAKFENCIFQFEFSGQPPAPEGLLLAKEILADPARSATHPS